MQHTKRLQDKCHQEEQQIHKLNLTVQELHLTITELKNARLKDQAACEQHLEKSRGY